VSEPRRRHAIVVHDEALALGCLEQYEAGLGVRQFSNLLQGELIGA